MCYWLVAVAFAWTALVIAIKESEGIWRWVLAIILAASVVSFSMSYRFGKLSSLFYITLVIAIICIPYLIWKGYDLFKR